jgi:ubiquinone/menaquinone biosynthesis C-methylase UbiE
MTADNAKVSAKRIPFQLRKTFDPFVQNYFQYIAGEQFVSKHILDKSVILDVGTGAGMLPILLRDTSHTVIGMDISRFAVQTARHSSGNSGSFIVGDAVSLPFKQGTFDVVVANGLFNRINDLSPFLDEFSRVIKSDGRILFDCNNEKTFIPHKQKNFQASYTKEAIEKHLTESELGLSDSDITFFMSLNQKKLIQSERMPLLVKWIGLWISVLMNMFAKRTPGLRSRGAHIWVCAHPF